MFQFNEEESENWRSQIVTSHAGRGGRFEPLNPNAETAAAMNAARRGELVNAGKPDKLLGSLNAGRKYAR